MKRSDFEEVRDLMDTLEDLENAWEKIHSDTSFDFRFQVTDCRDYKSKNHAETIEFTGVDPEDQSAVVHLLRGITFAQKSVRARLVELGVELDDQMDIKNPDAPHMKEQLRKMS